MRLSPPTPRTAPRRGFTLVELLIACALTVLIMAVMSTAFQAGMSTLSHLKSTVGLSEKLRSSEALIRRDLQAAHLQDGDGMTVAISNPNLKSQPWNAAGAKGYFEVVHGSAPGSANYVLEGTQDGVPSYRATDHALFFTSKLPAQSATTVYTGDVPLKDNATGGDPMSQSLPGLAPAGGNVSAAAWAEVGLFLVPTNRFTTTADGSNSLPLYSLVRKQRVLGTSPIELSVSPANQSGAVAMRDRFPEASLSTHIPGKTGTPPVDYLLMNNASSVITKVNRLGYLWDGTVGSGNGSAVTDYALLQAQPGSPKYGTDVLLNDVVSMQVRVMNQNGVFMDTLPASPTTGDFRLDSANPNGFGTQIRAVQIKLRVYDPANRLTRQATINADL